MHFLPFDLGKGGQPSMVDFYPTYVIIFLPARPYGQATLFNGISSSVKKPADRQ